jgi:23S rRNA pseudouridine1911/1915/1917 synthase
VVAVRLGTGRPHQIRIHLAAAGHPLVGDPLYGPGGVPRPGGCALPGDGGYRLHADRIVFPHPASGARVVVDCAPPPVLRGPA